MKQSSSRKWSLGRTAVILAIVTAVVFAVFLGYLAFANQSFPAEQRPFGDYAVMAAPPQFNGTELSFHIRWLNPDYLPVKAQITSDTTDSANSPACYTGLQSVTSGQIISMPFGLGSASPTAQNVQLSIDVTTVATGHEFTIVYTINSTAAANGDVTPKDISCQESGTVM